MFSRFLQDILATWSLTASLPSKSNSTINLLLLGRSGVGKSTFINSFDNYTHQSINDVKSLAHVKVSVPTAFELSDDDDVIHEFVIGEEKNADNNENLEFNGRSGTQGCKLYKYNFEDISINLIDTPGLVDTDGVDKDKENMEAILSFIGQYKYINGICIFLQPDEERLNDVLKYCILTLLCQLDHDAAANINWVFTKAASTCYKIGSTSRAIRLMIEEIQKSKPELNIPFSKTNYFLFDSVSFRYLVAKHKIKFNKSDVQTFTDSWERSRRESQRMIRYIVGLKPYDVRASLSIYHVRELIAELLPHLMKITNNIIEKEEDLCQKKAEVVNFEGNIEELRNILFIETTKLKTTILDQPRFVCQSVRCRIETLVNGETLISYPQICFVTDEIIKEARRWIVFSPITAFAAVGQEIAPALAFAASSVGAAVGAVGAVGAAGYWYFAGTCHCGCFNREHTLTFYEITEIKEQIEDPATKEKLQTTTDTVTIKRTFLNFLEEKIQSLQREKKVVDKANGLFAVFLKQRAIAPYNDAFPGHLKMLIKIAENLKDGETRAHRLKEHLKKYSELIEVIENGSLSEMGHESEGIKPQLIDKMMGQLKNLPSYGPAIENTLKAMKNIHMNYECAEEDQRTPVVKTKTPFFHGSSDPIFD